MTIKSENPLPRYTYGQKHKTISPRHPHLSVGITKYLLQDKTGKDQTKKSGTSDSAYKKVFSRISRIAQISVLPISHMSDTCRRLGVALLTWHMF